MADSNADHPVGMAYLLGNWATIGGRLEASGDWVTADLYQACLVFQRRFQLAADSSGQSAVSESPTGYCL